MKMMKKVLLFALAISVTPVTADDAKKAENFQKAKTEMLAGLDKRISHLQETKSCVSSASDRKALKACRQDARKKGEALRAEFKSKHQARKSEMMKRKAERKEKKKTEK